MTTQRIERVLDKLYNLKGDYNFVIAEIEENIKNAESAITTATEEQNDNEIKKSDVIGKLTVFNNQKDAFLSAFNDLDDETFSALRDIGIEANFGTMINLVNEKSPEYCDSLDKEIEDYENLIEEAKKTINDNAERVAELEDNKRVEEEKRTKLVSLLEQSLSTDEIEREALSTSYVKKTLMAFDLFTDEEIVSLAKLIMFPEDGLIEYDASYDDKKAQSFSINEPNETEEEPKEEVKEETEEVHEEEKVEEKEPVDTTKEELSYELEAPTEETKSTEDLSRAEEIYQNVISNSDVQDIIESHGDTTEINLQSLNASTPSEETKKEVEEPKTEEEPTPREFDEIDKYIESTGLDINKVSEELKQLLSESDIKLIEENYEILRSLYVSDEAIYRVVNKHNYLVDEDLNKKITLLRAKGISELKIKDMFEKEESKLRSNVDELGESLDLVINEDGKITDENIYKIDLDKTQYEENIKALEEAGYDIEEKEERNYTSVIYSSPYVSKDISILKDYLISIIKRNSKYALSVFWKNPNELVEDIDDLVEAGLENILETNPEVLEDKSSELIRRVKYCNENGHQIYVGEDKDAYCDYITSYIRFQEKLGNITDLPELETRKNNELSKISNNDYVASLVNILDNYYKENPEYSKFNNEIEAKADNIRRTVFTNINHEDAGKYTYKIKGTYISKNKVDRNLDIILESLSKNNQSYDGKEKEIFLTSVLYNLRASEDTLRTITGECLNQGGNK